MCLQLLNYFSKDTNGKNTLKNKSCKLDFIFIIKFDFIIFRLLLCVVVGKILFPTRLKHSKELNEESFVILMTLYCGNNLLVSVLISMV